MLRALVGLFIAACFVALAGAAFAEKRVALVIGNSAYQKVPELTNPPYDARVPKRAAKMSAGAPVLGPSSQARWRCLTKRPANSAFAKLANGQGRASHGLPNEYFILG
jgi:hypothetical protein